ncbi:MAG TPA: trimethylamine methyltransferase family protein, partial [Thermoleophilia bacterium]|nr:trimethylamine methyltransferase family protein [Thermoleophilia bacterium]
VMDCDVVGMIKRFARQNPIDASTSLAADIAEVGVGGHYLGRRSTREFYRAGEIWQPRVLQRGPFEAFANRPLVSEAAEQARAILGGHAVAPLPDDVVREIDEVIGRYARSVGAREDRVRWQG